MKMSQRSRGAVYEQGTRTSFGSHGGSPQGDRSGSRRAARWPRPLVGETQVRSGSAPAARRRPRNPFARTGRDRRHAVRLARAVSRGRRSELESPRNRGRQRRDPAAEIAGRRSEHEQRVVARKDSPYGGWTPFSLAEVEAMSRAALDEENLRRGARDARMGAGAF